MNTTREGITRLDVTLATNTSPKCLVARALEHDRFDAACKAAFNRLTRSTKTAKGRAGRPGGRRKWIFDQAAAGHFKPWAPLTECIQLAIDAGATEEDAMAILETIAADVRGHFMQKELMPQTVCEALRLETHADSEADKAQADAAACPTPANLERVLHATAAHERAEDVLVTVVRGHLGLVQ